uniref:T-box domain-containing protein n=1 Tax=Caenorhabditis tropicalis TaxID=1561998 RepID=A0A1I7TC19_9PELO
MSYQLSSGSLTVTLLNQDLYESIRPEVMEQVLNKTGRMFFPEPTFKFDGLDPDAEYKMAIRFDKISDKKFKYRGGNFVETHIESIQPRQSATFHHPSDTHSGEWWTDQIVKFSLFVTNDASNQPDNGILLESLCKYEAVLLVQKVDRNSTKVDQSLGNPVEFRFTSLQFVTSTAYHSQKIVEFKSKQNKYSGRDIRKKKLNAGMNTVPKKSKHSTSGGLPILNFSTSSNFPTNIPALIPAVNQPVYNGLVPTNPAHQPLAYPNQNMFPINYNHPTQTPYPVYPYMNQNQPPYHYPSGPVNNYHQNHHQFLPTFQQYSNVHPQYYPAQNYHYPPGHHF